MPNDPMPNDAVADDLITLRLSSVDVYDLAMTLLCAALDDEEEARRIEREDPDGAAHLRNCAQDTRRLYRVVKQGLSEMTPASA